MSYSQKKLVDLSKSGHFLEEEGAPQHIETVISNVFLFQKNVYKIYKNDNKFFNTNFRDISTKELRFDFTKRDFEWNNTLSPTIYLKLVGVAVKDSEVIESEIENAEELAIVMNRVESKDFLNEELLQGAISPEMAFVIGEQFGSSVERVQKSVQNKNYYKEFLGRINDLRDWFILAKEDVSKEEADKYCDFLLAFIEKNKARFEGQLSQEMTKDGDIHSHNAVFSNGDFHLLDTFPPKEEWATGHPAIALYRLGTDIWVFSGNRTLFEEFLKGYQEVREPVSRELEPFYILYAAGIMLSYQYHLAERDPAEKRGALLYHDFIKKYFDKYCTV